MQTSISSPRLDEDEDDDRQTPDGDDTTTDQRTNNTNNNGCSIDMELATFSPLELLNGDLKEANDESLLPDPPTVAIDSEDSPPTAKQKKIARVVMAVAFILLAMCVVLVGVTLSMSDHIDAMVRKMQEKNNLIPGGGSQSSKPFQHAHSDKQVKVSGGGVISSSDT